MRRLLWSLIAIFLPLYSTFELYERIHYSDIAKLKCDTMLYRTAYWRGECYFAIADRMLASEADAACDRRFKGAVLAENGIRKEIWETLGVNKTLYHSSSLSKGDKKVVCVYSTHFTCEEDTASTIPGKCTIKSTGKMTYYEAEKFCANRFGTLPTVTNDAENLMVNDEIGGSSMWVNIGYSKGWSDPNRSFGRFAVCNGTRELGLILARETDKWCPVDAAVGMGPNGFWNWFDKRTKLDVLCVRDAVNSFYTAHKRVKPTNPPPTRKPKPDPNVSGQCAENHRLNTITGKCQWTGPSNGCVMLKSSAGQRMVVIMPNYPKAAEADFGLYVGGKPIAGFNDLIVQAVVRYGCSANFYDRIKGETVAPKVMLENKSYGAYVIPSTANGLATNVEDGLSRITCKCESAPLQCEPMHKLNTVTGKCQWTGPAASCLRLENGEGRMMLVSMNKFPETTKQDLALWSKTFVNKHFNDKTVFAVVRHGCTASFYDRPVGEAIAPKVMLENKGYGSYVIPSWLNGMLTVPEDGLSRITCECYATASQCADGHKLNTVTGKCQWTGPADVCVVLENDIGQRLNVRIKDYPKNRHQDTRLWHNDKTKPVFNDRTVGAVVRKGCTAMFYDGTASFQREMIGGLKGYGTYVLPATANDMLSASNERLGLSQVMCQCEAPPLPCISLHKLNTVTGKCEWTGPANVCVELENANGQRLNVQIENYPQNRQQSVNLAHNDTKKPKFDDYTVGAVIRKGCTVTFYGVAPNEKMMLGGPKGYGTYAIPAAPNLLLSNADHKLGLSQVECSCPEKIITTCKALHQFNPENGKCEWTGPENACVQLTNYKNESDFIEIPDWPFQQGIEMNLWAPRSWMTPKYNDITVGTVVRLGCMATYYMHSEGGHFNPEVVLHANIRYGEYVVPSSFNGKVRYPTDGLTRVYCVCDKTATTLTKRAPPTCIDDHKWNSATGKCVWKSTPETCVRLETQKKKAYMPMRWFPGRTWDFLDLWASKHDDLLKSVVRAVVRNGCRVNFYSSFIPMKAKLLLADARYGVHKIPSADDGSLKVRADGLQYITCSCDMDHLRSLGTVPMPVRISCPPQHTLNNQTGYCEWTGPKDGCAELYTVLNRTQTFVTIPGYPKVTKYSYDLIKEGKKPFAEYTFKAVVRNGCRAAFYDARKRIIVQESGYGVYNLPSMAVGTISSVNGGVARIDCSCTDELTPAFTPEPAVKKKVIPAAEQCAEHHKYDNRTKSCEWTEKPDYCGQITNTKGGKLWLQIPNWPTNRRYDVHYGKSRMPDFDDHTVKIVVRQHCFALLDAGYYRPEFRIPLPYGTWPVASFFTPEPHKTKTIALGISRIRCECIS